MSRHHLCPKCNKRLWPFFNIQCPKKAKVKRIAIHLIKVSSRCAYCNRKNRYLVYEFDLFPVPGADKSSTVCLNHYIKKNVILLTKYLNMFNSHYKDNHIMEPFYNSLPKELKKPEIELLIKLLI
jgi:hypothetical protein